MDLAEGHVSAVQQVVDNDKMGCKAVNLGMCGVYNSWLVGCWFACGVAYRIAWLSAPRLLLSSSMHYHVVSLDAPAALHEIIRTCFGQPESSQVAAGRWL
eukprot:GHUV01052342.1.p1 GENE.GHUV01052342.1~~GHUV01052342.1.p1  ORF type:complete len:100 (-),score=14.06 GHUV01052342.1:194-493(-)